eukprot:746278-Lingulodinium_polyedra.AAC.1
MTSRVLQDKVMHAALVQMSFMEKEAFQPAAALPWALAFGNIEQNLRGLQFADEATETTTWKIQRLVRQGDMFNELVEAVKLFREVSFATVSVEQAHASVQLIQRHHPDQDLGTLLQRACLKTILKVLPLGESREHRARTKITRALDKLHSRVPNRCNGRVMFIKALLEAMKEKASRGHEAYTQARATKVIKASGRLWHQLSLQQQQHYHDEAQAWRQQQASKHQEEREELYNLLQVSEWRVEEEEWMQAHRPLDYSACTLTDEDIDSWQQFYLQLKGDPQRLADLVAQRDTIPLP